MTSHHASNNTLYNPKNPSDLTTDQADTLLVDAISPATWRRILTISRGLVNITCDAPACEDSLPLLFNLLRVLSSLIYLQV